MNMYPNPIRTIHQIEITSECNLRCKYCPHPKMARKKEHMSRGTFERTLSLIEHFVYNRTQGELSLTGVGEPTMHPLLPNFLRDARKILGPDRLLLFSTNGILLTKKLCKEIAPYNPRIYVSTHRPEKAAPALNLARKYGMLAETNTSFVTSAFNWAGQVEWEVTAPTITCSYLLNGWGVVLADGRITTCCMDAHGKNIIGHVDSYPMELATRPFPLCDDCHMLVPTSVDNQLLISVTDGERLMEVQNA